jgi:very-short-patch-repair endonuclease
VRDENHRHGGLRYARAAEVAARQWGNVTRPQLRAVGFSVREIDGMLARGLLHPRHRGVYAFGAPSPAAEAKWAAALLAAGEGSALSNTGAAAFYGQIAVREVTEVTAPTRRRGDDTLRIHTAKRFDVVRKRGLIVTTPAQTLLDLAAARWPIDRMTHELAASGVGSLDDLRTFARNRRGEPGAAALAKALDLPHTRSEWERRFLRWVRRLDGVPVPEMNDPIAHICVDCHWPAHKLVIELDTDPTHGTAWKRRDDAERDAWLKSRGIDVWRIREETWDPPTLETYLRHRLRP